MAAPATPFLRSPSPPRDRGRNHRAGTPSPPSTPGGHATRPVSGGALLVLVLTLASIIRTGYAYGREDMTSYIPQIRRAMDPSYLAHDWFLNLGLDHNTLAVQAMA